MGVFSSSVCKDLIYVFGFGSKEDTFCCYRYKNEYQIIIWKIGKYSDIDFTNISTSFVNRIPDFYFTIYMGIEHCKDLTINKRQIENKDTKMKITLKKNSSFFNILSNNDLHLLSERFELGYPDEKAHIIFDFHNSVKNINLSVRKINQQSILIILYPLESKKMDGTMLKRLLDFN